MPRSVAAHTLLHLRFLDFDRVTLQISPLLPSSPSAEDNIHLTLASQHLIRIALLICSASHVTQQPALAIWNSHTSPTLSTRPLLIRLAIVAEARQRTTHKTTALLCYLLTTALAHFARSALILYRGFTDPKVSSIHPSPLPHLYYLPGLEGFFHRWHICTSQHDLLTTLSLLPLPHD